MIYRTDAVEAMMDQLKHDRAHRAQATPERMHPCLHHALNTKIQVAAEAKQVYLTTRQETRLAEGEVIASSQPSARSFSPWARRAYISTVCCMCQERSRQEALSQATRDSWLGRKTRPPARLGCEVGKHKTSRDPLYWGVS